MKKFIAIILSLLMIVSFASCSSDKKEDKPKNVSSDSNSKVDNRNEEKDKVNGVVSFTLPKFGEEPYSSELTEEQIESGFLSVVVNEDGSATYTMARRDWLKMLDEIRTTGFDSFMNTSEDGYASFYSYEIGEEFDYITLYVDYDLYQSSSDPFALFGITITMSMVQCMYGIAQEDVGFTLNLVDYQTKEIIETINLPDYFEE